MRLKEISVMLLSLSALFASPFALAHAGASHVYGLADGFMHAATGLDHLLVIIAIGFWVGRGGDHGVTDMVYVLSTLLAGLLLGVCCLQFPQLQLPTILAITLTVIFIALWIAKPQHFAYLLSGGFMLYLGVSHILAMQVSAVSTGFVVGLFFSSVLLLMLGQILRQVVITRKPPTQSTG